MHACALGFIWCEYAVIVYVHLQWAEAGSTVGITGQVPPIKRTMISLRDADLTMSLCPVCDRQRRELWWEIWRWHPLAQKLLVNGRSDRREGHALAGKTKLNPVSLNASEMMRLLLFCVDLFILLPCPPFIYYVNALTFLVVKQTTAEVGEGLDISKKYISNFISRLFLCCRPSRPAWSVTALHRLHTN